MNVDLQGLKDRTDVLPMDGIVIHKGRRMTNDEIRIACNYGLECGYETAQEIPDEVIDKICDPYNLDFDRTKYDDAPKYYSIDYIEKIIRKLGNFWYNDWDADDLIRQIKEEL